ncbi:hypothetical protein MMC13_002354 [Lambiella insularis]|nr:hypothetical protein [Lambiella insularis]
MGSLRFSDFSNSPTIFVPAQIPSFSPISHQSCPRPMSAYPFQPHVSHQSEWKPAAASRPVITTNPSYKRSHDEIDDDDDDSASPFPASNPITPHEPVQEPTEYGEGMTVINASTGRSSSAESQTGTWWEENLEIERKASIKAAQSHLQSAKNTPARPTKSLRLESLPPPLHQADSPTSDDLSTGSQSCESPGYDAVTLLLGIGWKSIGKEEDTQAAAKGWAKYIENHYASLSKVQLLLKSDAHQAFLGKATEDASNVEGVQGFYLFSEDLNEGRLVAQNWKMCVTNLKVSSIAFEGQEILRATRTPTAIDIKQSASASGLSDHAQLEPISIEGAMDMD